MRFTIAINADTPEELKEALGAIVTALPANVFAGKSRGFMINVEPDYRELGPSPFASLNTEEVGQVHAGVAEIKAAVAAAEPKAPRTRRTEAEMQAELATTQEPPPTATPAAAPDPAPTQLKPKDAKDQALNILRDCFAIEKVAGDGYGAGQVKKLQKEMGVEKFAQVPDEKSLELLDRALALQAQLASVTGTSTPPADEPEPDPQDHLADESELEPTPEDEAF